MITTTMPILSAILHVIALLVFVAAISVEARYRWQSPSGVLSFRRVDRERTWRLRIILSLVSLSLPSSTSKRGYG